MFIARQIVLGFIMGIAAITPGLSGGALAATLGIYGPIIRALCSLTRTFKASVSYLLPLATGLALGILAFSRVMEWLMITSPSQVTLLFLGFVAGSLPALVREASSKGFRPRYLLATFLALLLMYRGAELLAWPQVAEGNFTALHYGYFGFIYAIGSVIPGISSSFILIHIGSFDDLLRAINTMYLPVLIPAGLGFTLGALLLVRAVEHMLAHHHGLTYFCILGFLLGSGLLIWPGLSGGTMFLVDTAIFLGGVALSAALLRLMSHRDGAIATR